MSLRQSEIDKLIEKLRKEYSEYSQRFSPKWFDLSAFEERLRFALKNKMNLEAFLLAEVSNLEKIKERYDDKSKKAAPKTSFTEKVETIIEEMNGKIDKYPSINFHPRAEYEFSKFYGAVNDYALHYFSALWGLIKERTLKEKLPQLETKLHHYSLRNGDRESKRIEDHIMLLNRPETRDIDIEKDKNDFLKESAFILRDIIELCDTAILHRDGTLDMPVNLEKLFTDEKCRAETKDNFSNLSGYGAILKIKDQALSIIEDFRLSAFKKKA